MNPQHLLELAERIASVPIGRPRQADLRRAVSTLYYSLFHLLTQRGANLVVSRADLRIQIARKFDHGKMKTVSDWFKKGKSPPHLASLLPIIPSGLAQLAATFVNLYESRQRADYDGNPEVDFTKFEVLELFAETKSAIQMWPVISTHPAVEVFLVSMLLHPFNNRGS